MTRLRLSFTKQGALRYVGHLDMAKTWERILRRAELPILYSQGFHPQPKVQFASALPVGCASTAEVMDVVLAQPLAPAVVLPAIARQLPEGLRVTCIEEVPLGAPPLQATLQSADYRLVVQTAEPIRMIDKRVQALLQSPSLSRERRGKTYDLRPLILDLRVLDSSLSQAQEGEAAGSVVLWARLRASQEAGTGRPDELLAALGLDEAPVDICRVGLNFGE